MNGDLENTTADSEEYSTADLRADIADLENALKRLGDWPEQSYTTTSYRQLRMSCLGYFSAILTTCGVFMQKLLLKHGYDRNNLSPRERTYLGIFKKAAELGLISKEFPAFWQQCYYVRNEAAHEYSGAVLNSVMEKSGDLISLAKELLPVFEDL